MQVNFEVRTSILAFHLLLLEKSRKDHAVVKVSGECGPPQKTWQKPRA